MCLLVAGHSPGHEPGGVSGDAAVFGLGAEEPRYLDTQKQYPHEKRGPVGELD